MENNQIRWIEKARDCLSDFVHGMKDDSVPGYYAYSLTGDCYTPRVRWGLGNTVFAVKILYMLGEIDEEIIDDIYKFIISFQVPDGYICDPLIEKSSLIYRWKYCFRTLDFNNLFNEQTKRAETRQAFSALRALGKKPKYVYKNIPYSHAAIKKYVTSLYWKNPWGAASHFSHLVFFLHNNRLLFDLHNKETIGLIDYSFELANQYQQDDGLWYAPGANIDMIHKINAAMKMLMAYEAAGRSNFRHSKKIVDMCLSTISRGDACNNLNIIYVLYNCSKKTKHRINEVKKYCIDQLNIYKKHYWPKYGGFSFHQKKANSFYYGAKISKGLPEPDIHGTALFLWGITLICKILEMDKQFHFNIPIT